MKILHVISYLSPRAGGIATVLRSLASYQVRTGLDITICSSNWGISIDGAISDGVNDIFLESGVKCFHFQYWSPMMLSLSMAKWVRRHLCQFDIIHIHGLYRFPPTYAAYVARKQGVPYIIRSHGSLDPYLYKKSSRSVLLKRLYERLFDLPNLNHAGAIHFTAEEERERVSFLGLRVPSFVIPNGIDWDRFDKLPERGAFRAILHIKGEPIVLFLGRLHFKKGLDLVIPAFDQVQHQYPGAKLVIVGPDNDNYGEQVRSWVSERKLDSNVRFVGHLDGADVIQAYVDADVFVLPSYTENFGMTVVEAMACELPVVISDQVNIHHEVAASGGGLVTHCDVKEIADAVLELLGDADRRKVMGQAGRQAVHESYTWPAIVHTLTMEYEKVIAHTKVKNNDS